MKGNSVYGIRKKGIHIFEDAWSVWNIAEDSTSFTPTHIQLCEMDEIE